MSLPLSAALVLCLFSLQATRFYPRDTYCEDWVERFGLSNIEVSDPEQMLGGYFPDNSLPASMVLDGTGTIRFRENGASDGLVTLRAAIDAVLADPRLS